MAAQYWVGDFFIDLSRNQITQKMQTQTIPPKALAVLTYLAKNANKVVSHDELLLEVWPDTVVTPNTLQRSIAQLRKALGKGSQYQTYIKTHAKQGYSLEVEVRWRDFTDTGMSTTQDTLLEVDSNSKITDEADLDNAQADKVSQVDLVSAKHDASNKTISTNLTLKLISILTVIAILSFVGVKVLSPTPPFKLAVTELRSLTATDNKEFGGIYSPDGEYIVFLRYSEEICINSNLWAKHTRTQKETQLTQYMARNGTPSFSKDGKQLVFIETESCEKPINQKDCYKLMTLDFDKALKNPQSPDLLMECKNSSIKKATWLDNNNVALLQNFSNRWKLVTYSIADNKSKVVYSLDGGSIIDYDYSIKDDIIALTSVHNDGQNYIEIVKPNGQILSSHRIEYPPEIPELRFLYPNFTPTSEQLIFSTGRQLFTLSFDGKITNISLPIDEPMGTPIFHPSGKRALMIKGNWDSDIARFSLSEASKSVASTSIPFTPILSILERSTLGEENANYQPNGELIAFKSDRSGEDQIWITNGNGSQQLTQFPVDTRISGLDWAVDGKSILVNANQELTQVFLNSNQQAFPFDYRVEQLFQWNSEDNTALLIARINGILKFVEHNLNNSKFRVITDKKVNWALKSEDGRLIYTDKLDRFWQPSPAEDQLIESLVNQGSDKRFIIKNNVIYGINEAHQFWSYELKTGRFELLGSTPDNVDLLTDINQTEVLLSIRIKAKKELAELILSD